MEYPVLDVKATGARIRELRRANHLKVEEVARFMGFESAQAVYKWQRGESLPTVDNLVALSRLCAIPMDEILREKKERAEEPSLALYGVMAGLTHHVPGWYNKRIVFRQFRRV